MSPRGAGRRRPSCRWCGLGNGEGMAERPTLDELRTRIRRDIGHFGGALPERYVLAWDGYLAALLEWGLLSVSDHAALQNLLPPLEDNPVVSILLGRPGGG